MKNLSYCLHCKKNTGNKNIRIVTTRNGQKMQKSICSVCGGKKTIFISKKKIK